MTEVVHWIGGSLRGIEISPLPRIYHTCPQTQKVPETDAAEESTERHQIQESTQHRQVSAGSHYFSYYSCGRCRGSWCGGSSPSAVWRSGWPVGFVANGSHGELTFLNKTGIIWRESFRRVVRVKCISVLKWWIESVAFPCVPLRPISIQFNTFVCICNSFAQFLHFQKRHRAIRVDYLSRTWGWCLVFSHVCPATFWKLKILTKIPSRNPYLLQSQ